MTIQEQNAKTISEELKWLSAVIDARFKNYFQTDLSVSIQDIAAPDLSNDTSYYAQFIRKYELSFQERIILILAIAPHIQPQALDLFLLKNANSDRCYTEFGGFKTATNSSFFPTGETAAFILAGDDLNTRFSVAQLFDKNHNFYKSNILKLANIDNALPILSGAIELQTWFLNYVTIGELNKPDFSNNFTAKLITTELEFSDLVLDSEVMNDIQEISTWIKHGNTLMHDWHLEKYLKPGFRSLFYGPQGTGKTMAAALLGKANGVDVYRIDLSRIVSKYIGETEKNLENIFNEAENKNWILFFDEAEALFGKRTQVSDSHDKYANQEVSYLLQRIEDHPGLIILCSNFKSNIDDAFLRRFQLIIQFPMPNVEQRAEIWKSSFPKDVPFDANVDFEEIAKNYELSGGAIINIIRYACLKAISAGSNLIKKSDILEGIRKELSKWKHN